MTRLPVRIDRLIPAAGWRCPDETLLAGYAEGTLDADSRDRVAAHLADCGSCLPKVGLLVRLASEPVPVVPAALLEEARHLRRKRTAPTIGWAAAAVLILASGLLLMRAGTDDPPSGSETRAIRGPESSADISITSPAEGGLLPSSAAVVRWTPVERALFYEIRVTDARGTLLWEGRSDDATVVLPTLPLNDSAGGFVWVSAQLPGNRSIRSRAVAFRVEGP